MVMEIPNQPQQIIQDTNKDKTEFVISKFIEPKEHMKATIEEKIQADKQQMIKEMNQALGKQIQEQRERQKQYDINKYCNLNDIREISNISREEIRNLLKDTTYCNDSVINTLYNGERKNNPVNCLIVIAISKLEGAYGKSKLANTHNNIGGMTSRAGEFKAYDSHAESIQDIIELLSDYYANIDNKSFVGYDIWSIGKTYCEGDTWSNKVTQIIQEMKTN